MFQWNFWGCIILVNTITAYPITSRGATVVPSSYCTSQNNYVGFAIQQSCRQPQQQWNRYDSRSRISWNTLENVSKQVRRKQRTLSMLSSSLDITDNDKNNSRSPSNSGKHDKPTKLAWIRTWLKWFVSVYFIFSIGYQVGGYNSGRKIIQNLIALDIHNGWSLHNKNNHENLFQILVEGNNRQNNPARMTQMVRRFPFLSLITSAWIVRELWGLVPLWIKQSHFVRRHRPLTGHERFEHDLIARQQQQQQQRIVDPDDITNLGTLGMKLQGLLQVAKTKLQGTTNAHNSSSTATTPPQDLEVLAPSLILIQLLKQYKARKIKDRTQFYEDSGSTGTRVTTDDMDELLQLPISSFWTTMSPTKQQQHHRNIQSPKHLLHGLDEAFEWADWAYDESKLGTLKENLERDGFSLLRHDKTQKPGYVGHYVALSKERNLVVIGVKGTSTLEDLLTDCCGSAVTHTLDAPFARTILDNENDNANNNATAATSNKKETSRRSHQIRCHEGVLISSKRLAQDLEPFMEELILPTSYNILIVGHSLGAAAASLLAVLLKSRIPSLATDVGGKRLRVIAFASPPILDYQNARACSSFITTIVNNSDVITRSSLANLSISLEVLKETNKKLQEKGLLSSSGAMINRISTAALLRKLAEGTKGELIFKPHELKDMVDRAYEKVDIADPDHLYVPGQVIIMFKRWENSKDYEKEVMKAKGDIVKSPSNITSKAFSYFQNTKLKVKQTPRDTQSDYGADDFVISRDGTAKVLRSIEMNEKMLSDHMPPAYRASIRSLLIDPSVPPVSQ